MPQTNDGATCRSRPRTHNLQQLSYRIVSLLHESSDLKCSLAQLPGVYNAKFLHNLNPAQFKYKKLSLLMQQLEGVRIDKTTSTPYIKLDDVKNVGGFWCTHEDCTEVTVPFSSHTELALHYCEYHEKLASAKTDLPPVTVAHDTMESKAVTGATFEPSNWRAAAIWNADQCVFIGRKLESYAVKHQARCDWTCTRPYCLIPVNACPWHLMKELPEPEGHLLEEHKMDAVQAVVREVQKGIAKRNIELLYADEEKLTSMRANQATSENLKRFALEHNVTTTDLGLALAGSNAIKVATDAADDAGSMHDYGESDEDNAIRQQWATATVNLAQYDRISGYIVRTSVGHEQVNTCGEKGESQLIQSLSGAGIPSSSYRTESQLVEQDLRNEPCGSRCTPDVKFNKPTNIHGCDVNWIEVKNKLLIPDVSSAQEMESYDRQVEKYTQRYGPGMVLWVKAGFCASIQKRHRDVFHFSCSFSKTQQSVKTPQTRQKNSYRAGTYTNLQRSLMSRSCASTIVRRMIPKITHPCFSDGQQLGFSGSILKQTSLPHVRTQSGRPLGGGLIQTSDVDVNVGQRRLAVDAAERRRQDSATVQEGGDA